MLGVVGGFGCVAIAYVIPIIGFLSTHKDSKKESYLYIVIASFLVAVGFGAAINSVLQLIFPSSVKKQ